MITYEETLNYTDLQKNILKALIRSREASILISSDTRECEVITRVTCVELIAFHTTDMKTEEDITIVKLALDSFLLNRDDVEIIKLSERNNERLKPKTNYFILKIKMHQDVIYRYGYSIMGGKIFLNKINSKSLDRILFYTIKEYEMKAYKTTIENIEKLYRLNGGNIEEIKEKVKLLMEEILRIKKTIYINPK